MKSKNLISLFMVADIIKEVNKLERDDVIRRHVYKHSISTSSGHR